MSYFQQQQQAQQQQQEMKLPASYYPQQQQQSTRSPLYEQMINQQEDQSRAIMLRQQQQARMQQMQAHQAQQAMLAAASSDPFSAQLVGSSLGGLPGIRDEFGRGADAAVDQDGDASSDGERIDHDAEEYRSEDGSASGSEGGDGEGEFVQQALQSSPYQAMPPQHQQQMSYASADGSNVRVNPSMAPQRYQ